MSCEQLHPLELQGLPISCKVESCKVRRVQRYRVRAAVRG
jgi:hypothetical protein